MDNYVYSELTEREGNDSWLRYRLTLGYDFDDLCLELKENHNGWAGNHRQTRSFILSKLEGEELIKKIKDYVDEFADDSQHEQKTLKKLEEELQKLNIDVRLSEV